MRSRGTELAGCTSSYLYDLDTGTEIAQGTAEGPNAEVLTALVDFGISFGILLLQDVAVIPAIAVLDLVNPNTASGGTWLDAILLVGLVIDARRPLVGDGQQPKTLSG